MANINRKGARKGAKRATACWIKSGSNRAAVVER